MKTQELKPTVDIAFKKLFGVEENKDLLISLINSIVDKTGSGYRYRITESLYTVCHSNF